MAQSLDALLQAVERLAATQDQMKREMTRLQAADLEILAKIPAPPPQSPATPKRKPPAVPPQRAPTTLTHRSVADQHPSECEGQTTASLRKDVRRRSGMRIT
jgi:hypothetical protein